jgi:hypothetical protein
VTTIGPGSSAITWAGRKAAAILGIPGPEPYLAPAIRDATPAVIRALDEAARIRAAIPNPHTDHSHEDSTGRTHTLMRDPALVTLAQLISDGMSPLQAARQLFATDGNGRQQ